MVIYHRSVKSNNMGLGIYLFPERSFIMMYSKNSNDSIKTQVRQDVPTTNVNLNKEDLVKLFNAFMRAATDRGVININGGIHVHIDKIVDMKKVNK